MKCLPRTQLCWQLIPGSASSLFQQHTRILHRFFESHLSLTDPQLTPRTLETCTKLFGWTRLSCLLASKWLFSRSKRTMSSARSLWFKITTVRPILFLAAERYFFRCWEDSWYARNHVLESVFLSFHPHCWLRTSVSYQSEPWWWRWVREEVGPEFRCSTESVHRSKKRGWRLECDCDLQVGDDIV